MPSSHNILAHTFAEEVEWKECLFDVTHLVQGNVGDISKRSNHGCISHYKYLLIRLADPVKMQFSWQQYKKYSSSSDEIRDS